MKSCVVYLSSITYLRDWARFYANAFHEEGYDVSFVDFADSANLVDNLGKTLTPGTSFILSIYGEGSGILKGAKSLYDSLGIPFLAVCVDHPEYYAAKMKTDSLYTFWGLYDESDFEYAAKYISPERNYFFAPNAGFLSSSPSVPFCEREYDLMFCGTIPDYENCRKTWKESGSPHITAFCDATVELLLADDRKTVCEAVEETLLHHNFFSLPKVGDNFHAYTALVSHYMRGYRRTALLKELAAYGLKIHCFGRKDQLDRLAHPNLIIHGYLDTPEYLQALSYSKIVINTSPMTKYAMTERLLSAMMNGAAVATDTNAYIDGYFSNDTSLIGYTHHDYQALGDKLSQYLSAPQRLAEIARSGEDIVKKNHSVRNRALNLISIAETGKGLLL